MRMDAVENLEGMIADYTDTKQTIGKADGFPLCGQSLLLLALC